MPIRPVLGSGSFSSWDGVRRGYLWGPTATVWQGGDPAPGLSVNVAKACSCGEDAAACPVPLCAPPPQRPQGRKHLVWSGCTRRLVPVYFRHHGPVGSWARETRQPGGGSVRPRESSVAPACARACVQERANGRGCGRRPHGRERTAATPWLPGEPQAPATGCQSASGCRGIDHSQHRHNTSDRNMDNTSIRRVQNNL